LAAGKIPFGSSLADLLVDFVFLAGVVVVVAFGHQTEVVGIDLAPEV